MDHVGIDLGKVHSQISVLTEDGEVIDRRIRTERARFEQVLATRPRARILIEASTESEWVARCLEAMGHEVVVADPNYAPMYAQRSRRVKTDRRDAEALAVAGRLGAYRAAHRTSDEGRHLRAVLGVRDTVVRTRARWIVHVQPLLRQRGYRVRPGKAETFVHRVREVPVPDVVWEEIEPLVTLLETLNTQIEGLDREANRLAERHPIAQRLMTVPGVGPITALNFVAVIDQVERFRDAQQVTSYLGLVPREWSSSEMQHRGAITRAGNAHMRALLVEAAWCILRRQKKSETATLRAWADRVKIRRGAGVAAVALARRLAKILYAIWRDGTVYDPEQLRRRAVTSQTTRG